MNRIAGTYYWLTERLYNEFAWAYDPVSWLVSLGGWSTVRSWVGDYIAGRRILEIGFGRRNTLIIGWNRKAQEVYDKIKEYPALGYDVIGFISPLQKDVGEDHHGAKVLGSYKDIVRVVETNNVEEIIISASRSSPKEVIKIISRCDALLVNLKIVPDLYDIVMAVLGPFIKRCPPVKIFGVGVCPFLQKHPNFI